MKSKEITDHKFEPDTLTCRWVAVNDNPHTKDIWYVRRDTVIFGVNEICSFTGTAEENERYAKEIADNHNTHEALKAALDDCFPLAVAWAGYYSRSETYGMEGKIHPRHQEIIDAARTILRPDMEA